MTTLDENDVKTFFVVMRSYIYEAAPHMKADELRKIENDARAIEQEYWFDRGWAAGEDSLLQRFTDNNAITNEDVAKIRSAQSHSRRESALKLLADIVRVNAQVAPHAKPRRGRGQPRKGNVLSDVDLAVLRQAMDTVHSDDKNGAVTNIRTTFLAALRGAVEQNCKDGKLAKTTTAEGHTKRITRWLDKLIAKLD